MTATTTIVKSYKAILTFALQAQAWLKANTDETKFRYAVKKAAKNAGEVEGRYQREMEKINVKHCATDKDTHVILLDSSGNFQFTKAGRAERDKERDDLFEMATEFEPYYVNPLDIPKGMTADEIEVFLEFVIPGHIVVSSSEKADAATQ